MEENNPLAGPEMDQSGRGVMGSLRVVVALGIVVLVLFGLYWVGKTLFVTTPSPEDGGEVPDTGVEVATECTNETVYANLDVALQDPANVCILDLSNQGLTALSPFIGHLTNLRELRLGGNQIGGLPSELGWLRSLEILDINHNLLTGLPPEIGWLQQLKVLDLSFNQITGLPSEFGWLRELETLNLSNNQITVLPAEVGWLAKVGTFDLRVNPLEPGQVEALQPYLPSTVFEVD